MAQAGALGRLNLQPPEELDTGAKRLTISQDAIQKVGTMGFATPSLPANGYRGEMPQDLTELGDDELGDLLNNLSQYCGYAEYQLALASVARDEAEARLDYISARVRIGIKANHAELRAEGEGKLTEKDKNDLVETEPRVVAARSESLYADASYHLIKVIRDKTQRDWETVSRRITQRGQEVERMRREANVSHVPTAARTFRRPGQ